MRFKILAISLSMGLPLLASAQGTAVTLYGNIDTAIQYVNHIPDGDSARKSSVHFTDVTASFPSFWGLRGIERISDNLSAVFALESGFTLGTGKSGQGDRLFGRQAWVGLKGDWGQLAFGRQYTMLNAGMRNANIMGPSAHGFGVLDSYIPNARMDNSITYVGHFDGLKLGVGYSMGRDNTYLGGPSSTGCGIDYTDASACRAYSAMLGYDADNWGVATAYDVITGSDGYPTFGGLDEPSKKDRRWMINGYLKFDSFKVSLIYLSRKNDGAEGTRLGKRSDIWTVGASYSVTPAVSIDAAVNYLKYKNADRSSGAWYYVARTKYAFSNRTSVYVSAAYINNKGASNHAASSGVAGLNPGAGENQTALMVGLRHSF